MAALATLTELEARLDFPLVDEVSEDDRTSIAESALEDLSEDARHYGSPAWTDPQNTPAIVKSLILRAAKRYLVNTDGFEQSRSGDETVGWGNVTKDEQAGSAHFAPAEIAQIEKAGRGGRLPSFGSFGTYAWNSQTFPVKRDRKGYVEWSEIL